MLQSPYLPGVGGTNSAPPPRLKKCPILVARKGPRIFGFPHTFLARGPVCHAVARKDAPLPHGWTSHSMRIAGACRPPRATVVVRGPLGPRGIGGARGGPQAPAIRFE